MLLAITGASCAGSPRFESTRADSTATAAAAATSAGELSRWFQDFPRTYRCDELVPGTIRGRLEARLWVDSTPPVDVPLGRAKVQLQFRDSSDARGAPWRFLELMSNELGEFEIDRVPLSTSEIVVEIFDPRIAGGEYRYVREQHAADLFRRCIRPEIDYRVPITTLH